MRSAILVDIREIIRQLRNGQSHRQVSRSVRVAHKTVSRYRELAEAHGWLSPDTPLPTPEEIQAALSELRGPLPAQNHSTLAKLKKAITQLNEDGVDEAMVMWERLRDGYGFTGSYWAVWRYMREHIWKASREACLRIHTDPGEEAQVDFGDVGPMWDPTQNRARKAYAFVMTLSWSRHQFVCHVFTQKIADWLMCHMRAFEFFGGVPERLIIDNLKAGISKACFDDPELNRSYRAFAEHYGFMIAPCPVYKPQQKGKVEAGVKFYKHNALAGRHFDTPLMDANKADEAALVWVLNRAGMRIHGTTRKQPLGQFERVERGHLGSLPETPFEPVTWKQVKLHRDCHVVFDYDYYSAPCRLIGQQVWVRASATRIEVLHNEIVVALHTRASEPGLFVTQTAHLPEYKARLANAAKPAVFRSRAQEIGPYTQKVVAELVEADSVLDHRRSAARLVLLAEKHTPELLERACKSACESRDIRPATVRTLVKLLATGWNGDGPADGPAVKPRPRHARSAAELVPVCPIQASSFQPAAALTQA